MVRNNSDVTQHELFFITFRFISYWLLYHVNLLDKLEQSGKQGLPCHAEHENKKGAEKRGQGSCDYRDDGIVYVEKWNGNSIVTVCSNYQRKHHVKGATLNVPQTHLIATYNKRINSVDLIDCLSTAYRLSIKVKGWYLPLFIYVLIVTLASVWKAHCDATNH